MVATTDTRALAAAKARSAELVGDRAYPPSVLREGYERARAIAVDTLAAVHELMHTTYATP